ncbi:hypothetical protein GQ457_09G009570 [Hibiscus cannabinus]
MGGMGFRDLAKFNIAILAKQGWQLLTRPNSLLAKVLKGRYYPSSSFMNASLGSNPSYTWKSIWCSRGLLEKGYGWRVGNGTTINIWSEPWISNNGDGRIQDTPINPRYSMVSDLIDPLSNSWNIDLIRVIFPPSQASQILGIQLPDLPHDDLFVWRKDNSGEYSVRSGYKLLCGDDAYPNEITTPYHADSISVYSAIWSTNIPQKVKINAWRFIKNYLPTTSNLALRRLHPRLGCCFCDLAQESVFHYLSSCPFSKQLFASVGINLPIFPVEQQWIQWLAHLFAQFSSHMMRLFVTTIWVLWTYRNKKIHENASQSVQQLSSFIFHYIQEQESLPSSHPSATRSVSEARWSPPPTDHVKVNFDASYFSISRESVSGVLIRDVNGLVMAARAYSHLNVPNPEVAEALACDQAVLFASSLGFRRVIVEGDSSSIIKKVQSSSLDKSDSFAMIVNIKRRFSDFANITFHHVRRLLNAPAHILAKMGRLFPLPKSWIGEAPSLVDEAVLRDRAWFASSA